MPAQLYRVPAHFEERPFDSSLYFGTFVLDRPARQRETATRIDP